MHPLKVNGLPCIRIGMLETIRRVFGAVHFSIVCPTATPIFYHMYPSSQPAEMALPIQALLKYKLRYSMLLTSGSRHAQHTAAHSCLFAHPSVAPLRHEKCSCRHPIPGGACPQIQQPWPEHRPIATKAISNAKQTTQALAPWLCSLRRAHCQC